MSEVVDANGKPIVSADDKGAGANGNGNGDGTGGDNKWWDGGGSWGGEHMIPKSRFDEVNDRMKKAEAIVAASEAQKQKEAEDKAKANGEYETVIASKEAEIESLKSKATKVEEYDAKLTEIVTSSLDEVKTAIWEEKLNKLLGVVWFDKLDALEKAESITKIKDLAKDLAPAPGAGSWGKGWTGIDPNKKASYDDAKKWGFNSLLSFAMTGGK